ncbi:MAG TPA: nucleoside diphosphate kinase regulator [Polyangiaceae bacterium]|nr:nucleoside diphosphate kinase regulator [Polyangiaceae bacterium]
MLSVTPPTLTDFDVSRLEVLVERLSRQAAPPSILPVLDQELDRAIVMKPEAIPASVVTMNSEVQVRDLETGFSRCLTLVFPSMASIEVGRVSVLAPMGLALLGRREGAQVAWETPRGIRRTQVERIVYQPEAAGRFDL